MAARKLNRPVRLLFDRATDTLMVGKRHPYLGTYQVAFRPDGTLTGLNLDYKSDAGDTYDCSFAVMDLSLLQSDGCYQIDTLRPPGRSTGPTSRATRPSARSAPCSRSR